jgi:hypothetical protein
MSIEELRELCKLTVELTKLRQAECPHLSIENFAPDLLAKLLRAHRASVPYADGRTPQAIALRVATP